ncbi:hypothetical protein X801_08761 [Opisthorchis viverrini]|uniref:Uncharacterized protein n=1 Tax=Opisthorchis viverrini TaxID=6198 RepID=A0A1S8WLW1_OPIVI|nr:hypothetical protein X801_08761 [Opisthorchis viverrini]
MRGLGALVHTRWYNGVEVEFCKDACKSQPNCFGFNWWLDDADRSYELDYSSGTLYEMKCCGKSVIHIRGSV